MPPLWDSSCVAAMLRMVIYDNIQGNDKFRRKMKKAYVVKVKINVPPCKFITTSLALFSVIIYFILVLTHLIISSASKITNLTFCYII